MELSTGLLFPFDVSDVSFGQTYFDVVASRAPMLTPSRCGNVEPLTQVFSDNPLEDILAKYWEHPFLWKSTQSKTAGIWGMGRGKRHSSLFMYGKAKKVDAVQFIELYKALAARLHPVDFGYLHALTDAEWQSGRATARDTLSPFNSGIVTAQLARFIPNLTWGTLFGRKYISLIGLDRLLSAPAALVEQWADDLVYVQVTNDINDLETSFSAFEAKRDEVKAHIGERLFFRSGRPDSQALVPSFEFCEALPK